MDADAWSKVDRGEKDFSNARDVIDQVSNLDHLQGFAERAHVDLIGSGRYSYNELTSSIAEAIGEHLPRIAADPSNQHRKSIRQPWRFPHSSSEPESIALREGPTGSPQPQEHFSAKHALLQNLKSQADWLPPLAEAKMPTEEFLAPLATPAAQAIPAYANFFSRAARKAWHMLPEVARHRLGPAIKKSMGG